MTEREPPRSPLARIIHEHFCCNADPLLQRAFGQRARDAAQRFHDEPS